MPGKTFQYDGESPGSELIGSIASLLSVTNVPNVLWGNYMLVVHGVPSVVDTIAFVVPDENLAKAVTVLRAAKFPQCSRGRSCVDDYNTESYRSSPPPSEHFHLNDGTSLGLYRQSKTLSKAGNLRTSAKIIPAFDRSQKPGYQPPLQRLIFPQSTPVVRVPSGACLVETYCTLYLCDFGTQYATFWRAMLTYVCEYIDPDAKLGRELDDERYRKFYHDYRAGKKATKEVFQEFRKAMGCKE